MKFVPTIAAISSILCATPFASADSLHTHWEKFKAHRAFHHLSADGQRAFQDILKARDILQTTGKTEAAIPALYDAQKRLAAAEKADKKFQAAESDLHPSPQHSILANHQPVVGQTDWLPVGGEFIVSETLAPEKKAAVISANAQLKTGNTDQAAQSMKVVGADADFIMALAPIAPVQGAVYRATVFTEGHHPQDAVDALNQALNSVVFVSESTIETLAPATPAPAKK
ncbi:YfdX family protein [Gluconobacter sp. OJB]|uniref:YfdX family protein n=1 Tax=Gluconobacter sp. OJB TaxID=3145196 RepID=UPI0031F9B8E9